MMKEERKEMKIKEKKTVNSCMFSDRNPNE
jgi:hypothetical protein